MKKRKKRKWFLTKIKNEKDIQKFADWLNKWGDFDKHEDCLDYKFVIKLKGGKLKPNHITKYGRGYNQAISDFYDKLGLEYEKEGVFNANVRKNKNL